MLAAETRGRAAPVPRSSLRRAFVSTRRGCHGDELCRPNSLCPGALRKFVSATPLTPPPTADGRSGRAPPFWRPAGGLARGQESLISTIRQRLQTALRTGVLPGYPLNGAGSTRAWRLPSRAPGVAGVLQRRRAA